MSNEIPYFEYQPPTSYNNRSGAIKLHGEVIHKIGNMAEFYTALGYTLEMGMDWLSPDEFIWETYFKPSNKNCPSCYQQHVVEYLLKHSDTFPAKYGKQYAEWFATYAEAKAACKTKVCMEPKK